MSIVVIGGGITGLSTAYYLSKLSSLNVTNKIILIESTKRVGGWLCSSRTNDGVVHEIGPKSIRVSGAAALNTLKLAEEINLTDEIIGVSTTNSAARKRLIADEQQLHYLPYKLSDLFGKKKPFSKPFYRYLLNDIFRSKLKLSENLDDISFYEFMRQRFDDDVAKYLSDPLCRGITAGDARKLSVRSLFPDIFNAERSRGSVIGGMLFPVNKKQTIANCEDSPLISKVRENKWTIWSCKDGLETFPKYLLNHLNKQSNQIEIRTNTSVKEIKFTGDDDDRKTEITLIDNQTKHESRLNAEHLFSTISSQALANCLTDDRLTKLKSYLNEIKSVHVAVVNLEYKGKNLFNYDGFGFLTLSSINSPVLGIVFDSICFPIHDAEKDITRITVMIGGEYFDKYLGDVDKLNDEKLLEISVKFARKYLKISSDPIRSVITINKNCIPQYYLGHHKLLSAIKNELTLNKLNIELLGSSYQGVSVNDCILNAKLAVMKHQF